MKSAKERYNERERQVINKHRTPRAVQVYLFGLPYNTAHDTARSFRGVVRAGTANCLEAAVTSAAILENHGYPPLILDLESQDNLDHVLHLYRSKRTALWGTVARSRDPGLCGRKAAFRTVRDLVESYIDPYVDYTGRITGYGVGNLGEIDGCDWRRSRKNIWKIESYLIEMPHRRIGSSDRRYRYWLNRYQEFMKSHPDRKPIYYDNRWTWLPGYRRCADWIL